MIPKILEEIKPEYPHLVGYSKPGGTYLIGPDTQNLNNSKLGDEPTCPINSEKSRAWAREIREAGNSVTARQD